MNQPVPICIRSFSLGLLLLCVAMLGCGEQEKIVRHEIPKDRSGLEHLRESTGLGGETPAEKKADSTENAEKDRMVVALALRDDATWFFKLNGPVSRIDETEDQWRPFLESVSFDDAGKPVWELPEGWTTAGPKPMRFATLVIDTKKPPVELAVSNLAAGQDLLLNVNRWRGQLGLDPTDEAALKDSLTTIEAGDQELKLFDATGKMSGGMMPPFARGGNGMGRPKNSAPPETGISKITFTPPEGWELGKPSPFLKARFSKTAGEQTAQISVSSLPAAANKWLPNAARWAGQVGLDPADETKLTELTEAVSVDGVDGKLIRLIPDVKEGAKATIAVMVPKGSNAWFFKLTGDRDLVDQNDQVLVEFMKTVKLP
ncbi:hypothetical protein N9L06_05410 [Mariniblastus sp.]|nr:hypothetical protein [Mariniblastus sp.]